MVEIGVLAAVSAVILFALTSVLSKIILTRLKSPYYYLLLQFFGMAPIFIVILVVTTDLSELSSQIPEIGIEIMISSVLAFLGMIALMMGISLGKASIAGIFLSTRVIFAVPLGYFLLGEVQPWYIYLIIIAIFFGSLMTSYDTSLPWGDILTGRVNGVRWLLMTSLFWSVSNFYTNKITQVVTPIAYLGLRVVIFLFLGLGFYPLGSRLFDKDRQKLDENTGILLIIFIVLSILAQILFVIALSSSLTISEGIGVFEGVATFVLSISIGKILGVSELEENYDRLSILIKVIGVVLATTGVLMIIIFQISPPGF